MKSEIRELIVTLARLASYHAGELVIDWLRARCLKDGLITVPESVSIMRELKRLGLNPHLMNMGALAKSGIF
jgi:hypothetical protein